MNVSSDFVKKPGLVIISHKIVINREHVMVALCGNCGLEIDKDDKYCRYCGIEITGTQYTSIGKSEY